MKKLSLVVSLCLLFALQSCKFGGGTEVTLNSKSFDEVIQQKENLTFSFNQNLVPDSISQDWQTTEYIQFSPPIPGRFKWKSSSELIFSPNAPFPPNTDFTATLTNELLKHADKKLSLGGDKIVTFHTPYLQFTNSNTYWKLGDNGKDAVIGATLGFNYAVKAEDLAKNLSVEVDGKNTTYNLLNTGTSSNVRLELPNVDFNEESNIQFILASGFKLSDNSRATNKPLEMSNVLAAPTSVSITGVEAEHDGVEGRVVVTTSQQVTADNLKKMIFFNPSIAFNVEANAAGFVITSENFDSATAYDMTLSKDIAGVFKGNLGEDVRQQITFGDLEPNIDILAGEAMYMGSRGQKNMAVRIVNVPKVKVKIIKIFENNIMAFMEQGYSWGWESFEENGDWQYYDYKYYNTEKYGKMIYEVEHDTQDLDKVGKTRLLNIDFTDKLPQFEGIYVVKIEDMERNFVTASTVMAYSDIGLIVKQEDNMIYVFANSLQTAQPLSGTNISFISKTNQRLFGTTTDENGLATFKNIDDIAKDFDFDVSMITAQKGNDYNYLLLQKTNVNTSRFEVGGKLPNPSGYDAFIYGERNLYRPGETIHASAIVRTNNWEMPQDIPVKMTLLLPNGKEFRTARKNLNEQGATEASFGLPDGTVTGTYHLELYTGDDVLLGSQPISVEEFMPDRIKVDISAPEEVKVGGKITIDGTALNLFGPPATNRNYQVEMSLKRKYFTPKGFEDYNFYIENDKTFGNSNQEGKTDENGKFSQTFEIPAAYADMGILQGRFYATVFDESGRPVNRAANFEVNTQDVFLGIGRFSNYVSTRTSMDIPLVAVTKEGKVQSETAQLQIIRYNWRTVLESTGRGRYRYKSQKEEVVEVNKQVNLSGENTAYTYTPSRSGSFEVRLSSTANTKAYVKQNFYAYSYGDTDNNSFEVNQEGEVTIKFDKEKYEVGESAKILFTTPFDGRLLVTLERDRVIRHLYFNTTNKAKEMTFEVTKDYVPNVFVSATLIRPMQELSVPLTVAHGYAPLMVENSRNKLPLKVIANESSRSNGKQKILVETVPNAEVTLAIVDEGILQIKNYQTPDPYGFFYQKRGLQVNSYDIYPYLFPEMMASSPLTGGGDFDLSKRTNPVTNKRVKLVRYWSGILTANSKGTVDYTIDIPQFSGDLRVMAVAYKDEKFASDATNMKVADPVVVTAGLPRFFSPNDEVTMPVTLANTTDKTGSAKVTVTTEGPIEVLGVSDNSADLKPNAENRVEFKVRAKESVGAGKVIVTVNALGETFTSVTEMTVRPPASLQKRSGSGMVKGGKAENLSMGSDFVPESIEGKLLVSNSPLAEFAGSLEYLVGYPHGCVEQTISKAFPQLYLSELTKNIGQKMRTATGPTSNNPNYNVQEAIKKLQSMQLSNGGMSYWPGGEEANTFGSVFAAHFLYEAKKAGFDVNEKALTSLNKYMKQMLRSKETMTYYYYDSNGQTQTREIAPKDIPYALYILAMIGEPDVATMNYYKANQNLLAIDGRYLLASAYMLAGDRAKSSQVLPANFTGETSKKVFDRSFYSPLRDRAIALNALVESDPDHPQIGILAKQLADDFRKTRWLNTQERVWTLLALGKVAKAANKGSVSATVQVGGKTVGTYSGKEDLVLSYADLKGDKVSIDAKGDGQLYYFWGIEGLTADGSYKEEDSFLKVRKTFYDRAGRVINDLTVKQNDLVVVKLSLTSTGAASVENVVVTDILPAGFEIENPRLNTMPNMEWIKDAATPDHQDFRDDRVNFFVTATSKPKDFYYMVRAVSPGEFVMGPASADAMYDGEYHSYHGGGMVTVTAK
ncbi:MAG: MG2 domain-containing protein [Chitinophagales bacterium]